MKHKFSVSLTLALVLAMLVTSLAVADNINNDITVDTIFVSDSTVVGYKVVGTGGDGGPSGPGGNCNAADGSKLTITINVPANVSAFGFTLLPGNKLEFTTCNDFQYVSFSATAAGDYPITVSYSDIGAGSYNNNADFTLHVNAPAVTDDTPPVLTPSVLGTLGNNGWYTSDVYVSWTVVDDESPISSTTGCGITPIEFDTAGTTSTCTATSAGGTNSQSITIMRDATAPTISGSASPAPNGAGWNNTDVTVSFTCGDNLSGIVSCGPDQTLGTDGADQSVTGTAVDSAGNSAGLTRGGIHIDKTAPVVAVVGVADGATYTLGSVPAAGCSSMDALSGLATTPILNVSGGPVGSVTATCNGALDNAGNSGSSSVTYNVIYNWNGFFQPIDMGILNVAKGGSGIPVKFSLSGNQGLNIFTAGYPRSLRSTVT